MTLHILLTPELKKTMPYTIKTIVNYGEIRVVFSDKNDRIEHVMTGDNAVLDGNEEDIINWLKPFDGVAIGNGIPQMEDFTIQHIKTE